jgi:hypothetical protein
VHAGDWSLHDVVRQILHGGQDQLRRSLFLVNRKAEAVFKNCGSIPILVIADRIGVPMLKKMKASLRRCGVDSIATLRM